LPPSPCAKKRKGPLVVSEIRVPDTYEDEVTATEVMVEDGRAVKRNLIRKVTVQRVERFPMFEADGEPIMVENPSAQGAEPVQAIFERPFTRIDRRVSHERRLKADAKLRPVSVMYDRLAVLMLPLLKKSHAAK